MDRAVKKCFGIKRGLLHQKPGLDTTILKLAEKQRDNAIANVAKGIKTPPLLKHGLDTPRKPFWYDGYMLAGKCPKCGAYYYGWALRFPRNQTCSRCGAGLEITEEDQSIFKGYSPFTAERHIVNPPTNVPSAKDRKKDSHVPNE